MPVYTAELYPTAIRNAGVGACNVAAGLALIIVPYMSLLVCYSHILPPNVYIIKLTIYCLHFIFCFLRIKFSHTFWCCWCQRSVFWAVWLSFSCQNQCHMKPWNAIQMHPSILLTISKKNGKQFDIHFLFLSILSIISLETDQWSIHLISVHTYFPLKLVH